MAPQQKSKLDIYVVSFNIFPCLSARSESHAVVGATDAEPGGHGGHPVPVVDAASFPIFEISENNSQQPRTAMKGQDGRQSEISENSATQGKDSLAKGHTIGARRAFGPFRWFQHPHPVARVII